ncbi:MAG: hypothetical protein ACTSQF_09070 [Candidatus Heimdallarchaeaceae archaeon]
MLNVAIAVILVIFLVAVVDHYKIKKEYKEKNWKYEEVYHINNVHSATLDALGIDEIRSDDWEETANSLDIPIDSLTINIFLKHLLHEDN